MIYDDGVACADEDVLGALLAGLLSVEERAAIVDHAASCERCRAVISLIVEADAGPTVGSAGPATGVPPVGPGARVGRYVIEKRLGAGGMGVVYAAVDTELRRRVALKLMRPDRGDEPASQNRERLLREARTLAQLSHPNVVTVFDIGVHDGQVFVAMELVDAGSLSAWLRQSPRSWRETVDAMIDVAKGLAAAHAAGVIHRDVKPDNILVGAHGRTRVTDFGLARITETTPGEIAGAFDSPLTATRAFVGTPMYMAPEQLAGGGADERTDQWAFCATLYEVVAGVRPFAAVDLEQRVRDIAAARVVAPPAGRRIPAWVIRIALRGLDHDPGKRWPSMDAIVRALARGRARRGRFALAAIATALVAVGGIAIAMASRAPKVIEVERARFAPRDTRHPACDCPYAACTPDGCVGVCNATNFMLGEPVPGINTSGAQDVLLGATLDGGAILYATGRGCEVDHLMLARRAGSTFVPIDITPRVAAAVGGTGALENSATLSPTGTSIVSRTPDLHHFVRLRIENDNIGAADPTEFADLTPPMTSQDLLANPVLSADELTLYFVLGITPDSPTDGGIYVSQRGDVHQPFPRAQRARGRVRTYSAVTGISPDGLSLFVARDFTTDVLMRTTTREEFMEMPAALYGWRAIPIASCGRILTTSTPGGCAQEDIIYLDAVPR